MIDMPKSSLPSPFGMGDEWYEEVKEIYNRGMDYISWSLKKDKAWKKSWECTYVYKKLVKQGAIKRLSRRPPVSEIP